jgi:hypothetical protein
MTDCADVDMGFNPLKFCLRHGYSLLLTLMDFSAILFCSGAWHYSDEKARRQAFEGSVIL